MNRDDARLVSPSSLPVHYRTLAVLVMFVSGATLCTPGQTSTGGTLLTFSNFPLGTYITNQYAGAGIIFSGIDPVSNYPPFIGSDPTRFSTSPVLFGQPLITGISDGIAAEFVNPVTQFQLDAGYFGVLHSTQLIWYDSSGKILGSETNSQLGIQTFNVTGIGIKSWVIKLVAPDPNNNLAIDNVMFQSSSCQVTLPSQWSQGVGVWANDTYNNYNSKGPQCIQGNGATNCKIHALGCAETTLAMALSKAGVRNINGSSFNPGTLNNFMKLPNRLYDPAHNVKFEETTRVLLPGKRFVAESSTQTQTLDNALCAGFPEIVGIDLDENNVPTHYVLVTGNQNGSYQIVDPGDRTNTQLDTADFVTRGHIVDPPGDLSALDVYLDTNANLLVTAPDGSKTGFDSSSGSIVEGIMQSNYFVDSLRNDDTGIPPSVRSHSVLLFQPVQGSFSVVVTGLSLGSFTLEIDSFSVDGSAQPEISVSGVANIGSTSMFQIGYSPFVGASSTIVRAATYQSTLADIANSLQIGLINNTGIANSLSAKIQAAFSAGKENEVNDVSEALKAFGSEVKAQNGKHITGDAPQILLEDVAYLISHLSTGTD